MKYEGMIRMLTNKILQMYPDEVNDERTRYLAVLSMNRCLYHMEQEDNGELYCKDCGTGEWLIEDEQKETIICLGCGRALFWAYDDD